MGANKVPYIVTNDGRTIRFPHPDICVHDTIKYDLFNKKIIDYAKMEPGNIAYGITGNNVGRVGII